MFCHQVKQEKVPGYYISTIKLPFDHGFYDGKELWYETMVFPTDSNGEVTSYLEIEMKRYETEEQALEGHQQTVEKYSGRIH